MIDAEICRALCEANFSPEAAVAEFNRVLKSGSVARITFRSGTERPA